MGKLLNRRRYMGWGSALPYDAELEYLSRPYAASSEDSSPYIDTGIYGDLDTEFGMEYMMTVSISSAPVGGYRGTDNNITLFTGTDSNDNRFGVTTAKANNTVGVKYSVYINRYVYKRSDGLEIPINYNVSFQTGGSLRIGNWNRNDQGFGGRIYSAYIKQNNVLIMDLIPVRVGQVGYMYDKVSKQLFGNGGTGSFILGPDKT